MENWVKIKGFENYSVSTLGNIRRDVTRTCAKAGRLLKICVAGEYKHVSLQDNGREYTRNIHKLVAENFLGDRPEGMEINHKDGNKRNNCLENLEYVTRKENAQHAIRLGLLRPQRGSGHWISKLDERKVLKIRNLHQAGMNQRAIARIFDVCFQSINLIVLRKTWRHV